jgi:hypothetical protein
MSIKQPFRILLETEKGKKYSYISCNNQVTSSVSQSLFSSDDFPNYAMSASQVWERITGSISCSYQNQFEFSSSADQFNVAKTFSDEIYLSSSLNGFGESGSIQFKYTGIQSENGVRDRLNRFKFFGSGFCTALNLVENFWYRTDEFKLTSGSENHYFRGDVDAESLTVLNNFNVASVGSVTTHLPFRIDKTDSKFIKFVNVSGSDLPNNDLYFGYNQLTNNYELSASFKDGETSKFNIGGVTRLNTTNIGLGTSVSSLNDEPQLVIDGGTDAALASTNSGYIILTGNGYAMAIDNNEIQAKTDGTEASNLLLQHEGGNVITNHDAGNFMIGDTGESGADVLSFTPPAKLTVVGDISASGKITANEYYVNVVTSSITYSDGSTKFGDSSDDTHIFTGSLSGEKHLTISGDISASGDVFVDGTVSASNFHLTSSGGVTVHMGMSGDDNIGKWAFHRDGTRKHLIYLDGRDDQIVPQDSLVFKHGVIADGNDHINFHMQQDDQTVYFHGDIHVGQYIKHKGDTNTYINFTDDDINITVGGINMIDLTEDSNDEITFNEGAADLDFRVEGEDDPNLLFTDATTPGRVGIGTNTPTKKLTVAGSISGSDLYLASGSNPLITLERINSSQNVGIVYKNTQGHMVAGIDNDKQNSGANIFGIGYHGDIIDDDGTDHATFVVTGSQVVINNATSASSGAALTVGGNISGSGTVTAKTFRSEKINIVTTAVDNTWYYFPIGPNPYSSAQDPGNTVPLSGFQATAMCNLSIKRLKLTFFYLVENMGTLSMKLQKYDGSGDPDSTSNWVDVGTTWTIKSADLVNGERAYHAPSDWDISAGENYILALNSNTSGGQVNVLWMNGGITIEEDWNNQVSS